MWLLLMLLRSQRGRVVATTRLSKPRVGEGDQSTDDPGDQRRGVVGEVGRLLMKLATEDWHSYRRRGGPMMEADDGRE
jgi:hypothetical protein